MTPRTARPVLVGAVGVALVLGGVAACTGSDTPDPDGPTGTAAPTSTEEPVEDDLSPEELSEALFASEEVVLASVDGEIPDRAEPIPATVEITDVHAGPTSTVVRFTLVADDDEGRVIELSAFNERRLRTDDIRDVAVVDAAGGLRLQPFVGGGEAPFDAYCTCSASPRGVTTAGLPLTATFPPLAADAETITFELPGFPALDGVPVRRD